MVLKVAALNGPFTRDPEEALLDFLYEKYVIASPPKAEVVFMRNFKDMGFVNAIILRTGPIDRADVEIGASRQRFMHRCRLQIRCRGQNSEADLFAIQDHLTDILNSDFTFGSTTNRETSVVYSTGIEDVWIDSFGPFRQDDAIEGLAIPETEKSLAATVTFWYDKVL